MTLTIIEGIGKAKLIDGTSEKDNITVGLEDDGTCQEILKTIQWGRIKLEAKYTAHLSGYTIPPYTDTCNIFIEDKWSQNERLDDGTGSYNALFPSIAATKEGMLGEAYACWADDRELVKSRVCVDQRKFNSTDNLCYWGTDEEIDDGSCISFVAMPDMAMSRNDFPRFVWVDDRPNAWNERKTSDKSITQDYITEQPDWQNRSGPGGYSYNIYTAAIDETNNINLSHTPDGEWSTAPTIAWLYPVGGATAAGYVAWADSRVSEWTFYVKFYFNYGSAYHSWGSNPEPLIITDPVTSEVIDYHASSASTHTNYVLGSPRMAGTSQAVYLVWVENDNRIRSARSELGGPWHYSGEVTGSSESIPAIAEDPTTGKDKVFVAWASGGHIYVSYYEGGMWNGNIRVTDDETVSASEPSIAVDALGRPHIIWVDERNGRRDVYYTYCYNWPEYWLTNIQVNDKTRAIGGGNGVQTPEIAISWTDKTIPEIGKVGKAYAVWSQDDTSDGYHVYFSERNLLMEEIPVTRIMSE